MNVDNVARMFRAALVRVWGSVGEKVAFDVEVGATLGDVVATLSYDRNRARAEGRKLLSHASNHVLVVHPSLFERDPIVVAKYVLHEAIHVGYPEHDEGFEEIAEAVGTASTANIIEGGLYEVELEKEGAREGDFKVVFATKSRLEAHTYASEQKAGPGRYRISF